MTRSVRLMTGTTGALLLVSAIALLILLPVANVWPWLLLFISVGAGLMTGFVVENDEARASRQAARQQD